MPLRVTAVSRSALACAVVLAMTLSPSPSPALAALSAGDLASQAMRVRTQLRTSREDMARNLIEYNRLTSALATTHAQVSQLTVTLAELRRSLRKDQLQLNGLAAVRYETGSAGFIEVVLGARTWDQLMLGLDYIASIAQHTASVVGAVRTARARAERVQSDLKQRESRLVALRKDIQAQRAKIAKAIVQQQASLDSLDVRIVQMVNEQERAAQSGGSGTLDVPVGGNGWMSAATLVPGASAQVDGSGSYVVPKGQPTRYQTIGLGFDWGTSTYGNADNSPPGTASASNRPFLEGELTCANKILPFGTLLAVTYGGKHEIVVVSDRGPYITGRSLDLSTAAANAVGLPGVDTVHVEIVLPE